MPAVNFSSHQDTYEILVTSSPIYECALGIAAFTWPEMVDKLERTPSEWKRMTDRLSEETSEAVRLSGRVHTWRSLLFLAHRCSFLANTSSSDHVSAFTAWMSELGSDLRVQAAPYLGLDYIHRVESALAGDLTQQTLLLSEYADDPLIHPNLKYLFDISSEELERHLKQLLIGWYEALPHRETVESALVDDAKNTKLLASSVALPELVRCITNGIEFQLEPMTRRIWLIPQMSYRPFTISNRLAETSIYYYPISDERMPGQHEGQWALQVANLYKAVGDLHRVRLLRLLRQSPRTVTEVGHLLDVAKSTAHHHLTLLRSVGLVRIEQGVYVLDTEQVRMLGSELMAYLQLDGQL